MKKFILFSVILFTILFLSTCKKDCDDNPPDPPPDTIPDTTNCNPLILSLSENDLSFLQFCDSMDILFFNQNNNTTFKNLLNLHDTSYSCTYGHEYWVLNYGSDSPNWRIIYSLRSTFNNPLNLDIIIGPPSPTGQFYHTYEVGTDSFPDYDSLNLSGVIFYDVYKAQPVGLTYPDLFFTKEQGVVGFYDFSENFWVWKE